MKIVPKYIELRYPDGKLAARYDPGRGLLEMQKAGVKVLFDLALLSDLPIDFTPDSCYTSDSDSFGDALQKSVASNN
jgi:hypothetical protein